MVVNVIRIINRPRGSGSKAHIRHPVQMKEIRGSNAYFLCGEKAEYKDMEYWSNYPLVRIWDFYKEENMCKNCAGAWFALSAANLGAASI